MRALAAAVLEALPVDLLESTFEAAEAALVPVVLVAIEFSLKNINAQGKPHAEGGSACVLGYVRLTCMARATAMIATVDSLLIPLFFCKENRSMTTHMLTKINLTVRFRHVGTACCRVMNLVVSIRLLVGVYDKSRHWIFL